MTFTIRLADKKADRAAIWAIMEPVIRAGETYPLPRDMKDKAALAYWLSSLHTTFIAEDETGIIGTYYIRPNNSGGGAHICNCGYMVALDAEGKGVATAMCEHSLMTAREMNFTAMQSIPAPSPCGRAWASIPFAACPASSAHRVWAKWTRW